MKTRTPERHIDKVTVDFSTECREKYENGQKEHGGELWRKPVAGMIGEEIVDQWVYYHVLREQINTVKQLLQKEILRTTNGGEDVSDNLAKAYNILEYGNPEGEKTSD